jgi:hypothetical protein
MLKLNILVALIILLGGIIVLNYLDLMATPIFLLIGAIIFFFASIQELINVVEEKYHGHF